MGDLLYLIIGIAVLGVLLVVGLLARTRTGRAAPPADATDVIATPVETAPEELDTAPVEAPVETPVAPALEKPEGTAARLQRLRARLAGSQGGFGRGLLALISRDRLDEDTWEAIED